MKMPIFRSTSAAMIAVAAFILCHSAHASTRSTAGTPWEALQEQLDAGKNVLLSLEVDRAAQVKANMPEAVCVYMEPSTEELLRARYEAAARSRFEVAARMDRAAQEKEKAGFCDCTIFTDDAEQAAEWLNTLIDRA